MKRMHCPRVSVVSPWNADLISPRWIYLTDIAQRIASSATLGLLSNFHQLVERARWWLVMVIKVPRRDQILEFAIKIGRRNSADSRPRTWTFLVGWWLERGAKLVGSEEEKGVLTSGLRRLLRTIARQFVISIRRLLDRSIDGGHTLLPSPTMHPRLTGAGCSGEGSSSGSANWQRRIVLLSIHGNTFTYALPAGLASVN